MRPKGSPRLGTRGRTGAGVNQASSCPHSTTIHVYVGATPPQVCDFCSAPAAKHSENCRNFNLVIGTTHGTIKVHFTGDWNSCAACHGDIDRGDWAALDRRHVAVARTTHAGFRANRRGSP